MKVISIIWKRNIRALVVKLEKKLFNHTTINNVHFKKDAVFERTQKLSLQMLKAREPSPLLLRRSAMKL